MLSINKHTTTNTYNMPIRTTYVDLGQPGGRRIVHRKRRHHVGGLTFNPVNGVLKGLAGLFGLGRRRHVAAGRRRPVHRRRAIII